MLSRVVMKMMATETGRCLIWSPTLEVLHCSCKKDFQIFRCIQYARREAGMDVPQNLSELPSSLAEKPIAAPSPTATPSLERLKAQCNALHGKVRHYRERLPACESKLVAELKSVQTKVAELKKFINAILDCDWCLKGKLARIMLLRLIKLQIQFVALALINLSW